MSWWFDIYAAVTFSLIIIHDLFRIIHNHGSIHINVEVFRNIFYFLFIFKFTRNMGPNTKLLTTLIIIIILTHTFLEKTSIYKYLLSKIYFSEHL